MAETRVGWVVNEKQATYTGRFGDILLLDAEDYPKIAEFYIQIPPIGYKYRTARAVTKINGTRKTLSIPRTILGLTGTQIVSYRNGNPFDMRKCNLRVLPVRGPERRGREVRDGVVYEHTSHGDVLFDEADLLKLTSYLISVSSRRKDNYLVVLARKQGKPGHTLGRVIMNAGPGHVVDHINRNTLDNRRANLRLCTTCQNNWNTGPRCGKAFKGVYARREPRKRVNEYITYRAVIRVGGYLHYLGCYKSQEEAARAYDQAAMDYHGEFACLNFPIRSA